MAALPLGFCELPLPLPEPPLPDCAKAMPVASINVNNRFFVMCCSFEVFQFARRATKIPHGLREGK